MMKSAIGSTPSPLFKFEKTAHGDEKMRLQAMRAGAVKFLTKPFDGETLLEAIRVALEG
jgi:FixJ family two-component response regulator